MTWAEFQGLTLAEYEALEERRAVAARHARFNAGLVAAALLNAHRSEDSDPVSPFDFVPGLPELDPAALERAALRKSTKKAIAVAFASKPGMTRTEALAERAAMVKRMTAEGVEDADGLIREVFPEL